jgi:hypothetical protein
MEVVAAAREATLSAKSIWTVDGMMIGGGAQRVGDLRCTTRQHIFLLIYIIKDFPVRMKLSPNRKHISTVWSRGIDGRMMGAMWYQAQSSPETHVCGSEHVILPDCSARCHQSEETWWYMRAIQR